jgi:hypothetical protein
MDSSVFFLAIAIILVGVLVFVAIWLTSHHTHDFDKEAYQADFLQIENTLARENKLSYNACLIESDKLLDKAMMEMGLPGKTMGERLKRSGSKFSQLNSVWYVHKMRNRIAHERGFSVEYTQSRHALQTYRQALKDLGAI